MSESGRSPNRQGPRAHGNAVPDVLDVECLSVAYGKVLAVRGVSLRVAPGSIVTVIGPNGAGKTTLLAAIAGLMPAQGAIRCFGDDLRAWPVEERVARGVVLVPEKRELFASMSVADNLLLGGFTRRRDHATAAALAEVYARFPRLAERRAQLAGTLSGGERQMLALGRALMSAPRLLLLDEPSLGLAPLVVRDIFAIIASLRTTGAAVLLVEQNARAALQVADYGYVLETGELALEGPSAELASNPRVAATYLGHGGKAREIRLDG
jgi:branched-chain amino acid transport system ATP-binding protein